MRVWKHRIEGILLLIIGIALLIGLVGHRVPDTIQGIGVNLRILDNFRPQLLVLALIGSALLGIARVQRLAALTAVFSVLGGFVIAYDYRTRLPTSLSTEPTSTIEVLWFNLLKENTITPERLGEELLNSNADLIVLAESAPAFAAIPALSDIYPYRAGCETLDTCELLILSRIPLGPISFENTPFGPQRLARFHILRTDGPAVTVVAVHRVKPWYLGLTGTGEEWMNAVLGGRPDRPMIVMGDFNATPWSRRMSQLAHTHGLHSHVRPIATWPLQAGKLGLTIDHVLTRGPAQIRTLDTWGASLGSNHAGLRASVGIWDAKETN